MSNKVSRREFLAGGSSLGLLVLPNRVEAQTDCVFCQFAANKGKFFKVWEDKDLLAFLDYRPLNAGHTLLIPKRHFEYLFEMDKKLYSKITERMRELSKPLKTATNALRIGVIVEGFGVAHAHVHLVPLHGGGELLKKGAIGVPDGEFSKMAEKIKSEIAKEKL
jgi:histidine triad (HIT) family protein